jgi:ssDNA-binding Zn-finger/Zn-ribbon topoisomerase 1
MAGKLPEDTTGQVNGWYCPTCGQVTYGIHLHHGVTPMFLGCRATPDCTGVAASLMYPWSRRLSEADDRLPAWLGRPGTGVTLEWYMPDDQELLELEPQALDHVRNGGLLMRPLTSDGMRLLESHLAPA